MSSSGVSRAALQVKLLSFLMGRSLSSIFLDSFDDLMITDKMFFPQSPLDLKLQSSQLTRKQVTLSEVKIQL